MFSESVFLLSLGTGGSTRVNHFSIVQAVALDKRLLSARSYAGDCFLTIDLVQLLSFAVMPEQNEVEKLNHQFRINPTSPHDSDILVGSHNIVNGEGTREEKSRQLQQFDLW